MNLKLPSGFGPVAVTGASGFVGRRVCDVLVDAGIAVRPLTRPEFDLSNAVGIDSELLRGCCAVVHLAAHIPINQSDPAAAEPCWRINALGTWRLTEAMHAAGVPRLVQTTAANAYAPGIEHPCETAAMFPVQRAPFYLSSKMAQEVFAHHAERALGLTVTTLRLTSVYGRGQQTGPVPAFARALSAGRRVELANGGRFGADFVTVDDVAQAVALLLVNDQGGVFNIGSGARSTIRQIAVTLAQICGADEALITDRAGEAADDWGFPSPDISKVKALGFTPTNLRQGLEDLVRLLSGSGA